MKRLRIKAGYQILLAAVFLIILCGCSEAVHIYPDDFDFRLDFGVDGKNRIDTFNGSFTKDLVIDGTATIDLIIPENIMKDIYDKMMEIDIMSFPDTLDLDDLFITPSCDYDLHITANGINKAIVWTDGFFTSMEEGLPAKNIKFLELVKYISDYIYSTDEYKQMPEANGAYE